MDPIAYTYEASEHCPDCAQARFGLDADGFITGTDNDENPVGAVFSWDAFEDRDMVCGTCYEVIHELQEAS